MNLTEYQKSQLAAIGTILTEYILREQSGEGNEDSDAKQYIFEHAMGIFYGPEIWAQLRKWREPKECPTCQRKVTFHNSEESK